MKTMKCRYLMIVLILELLCTGCTRLCRPLTCEEEAMVRETLDETSPRAENNQPKAIPEFKFSFGGPRGVRDPLPAEKVSDRNILLDNT